MGSHPGCNYRHPNNNRKTCTCKRKNHKVGMFNRDVKIPRFRCAGIAHVHVHQNLGILTSQMFLVYQGYIWHSILLLASKRVNVIIKRPLTPAKLSRLPVKRLYFHLRRNFVKRFRTTYQVLNYLFNISVFFVVLCIPLKSNFVQVQKKGVPV